MEALLNKYPSITSMSDYDIGECLLPPLDIDTGDHPPICIPPRRMNPHQKEKIRIHVQGRDYKTFQFRMEFPTSTSDQTGWGC